MSKWTRIHGTVVEGYRVASGQAQDNPYPEGTIKMQTPFFLREGLDLRAYHPATIGVSCGPWTFVVKRPEYTFRNVKWSPDHHAEDFSFSRCRITYAGVTVDGLVYYPHPDTKIGHHHDRSTLEIIAPYLEGIRYGSTVELDINTDEIVIQDAGSGERVDKPSDFE
jgi:hypothetical protein